MHPLREALIGTGPYSNCKACGRKVSFRLQRCPYCREPNPITRNDLGWRADYNKVLDPTVSEKWKSTRTILLRILRGLAILVFIAISATIFVFDYHPNLVTKYLGLRVDPSEEWLSTLYVIMFVLLPISFTFALIPEE